MDLYKLKNVFYAMRLMFPLILISFLLEFQYSRANEPYDNDLSGKNLICLSESDSIDDYGIKFFSNKRVILYSLDKFIYELFQYKRSYKTDKRNIKIYKGNEIDFLINRKSLRFSNKKCKITKQDPIFILKNRIQSLKKFKTKNNLL